MLGQKLARTVISRNVLENSCGKSPDEHHAMDVRLERGGQPGGLLVVAVKISYPTGPNSSQISDIKPTNQLQLHRRLEVNETELGGKTSAWKRSCLPFRLEKMLEHRQLDEISSTSFTLIMINLLTKYAEKKLNASRPTGMDKFDGTTLRGMDFADLLPTNDLLDIVFPQH